jgi:hypothetical protein
VKDKYPVGTRILFKSANILGTVIPNFKLPGDICIRWDNDRGVSSYDPEFLDEHCEIHYGG